MTAITERIPLEEISRHARQIRPGRTILAAITGILFGLGWITARLFALAWLTLAHAVTAVRLGWQHAQQNPRPPRSVILAEAHEMAAEIERLQQEIARLNGG